MIVELFGKLSSLSWKWRVAWKCCRFCLKLWFEREDLGMCANNICTWMFGLYWDLIDSWGEILVPSPCKYFFSDIVPFPDVDKDKEAFSELRTVHLCNVSQNCLLEWNSTGWFHQLPRPSVECQDCPDCLLGHNSANWSHLPARPAAHKSQCLSVSVQFYFPVTHLTSCLVSALLDLLE